MSGTVASGPLRSERLLCLVGRLNDIGRDIVDLLLRERSAERRHPAAAARDLPHDDGELLALAERSGIDPRLAVDVMAGSPIGSPMLKARADLVLDLPDEAWLDVSLMQKDVALALDAERELHIPLPSASAADSMLTVARAFGYQRPGRRAGVTGVPHSGG